MWLLFLDLDRCDNFFDFFLLLRLFLLPWFFLTNAMIRWNIFNFDHIAYLEAWSKLQGIPLAVDVELDLPLLDVDDRSHDIEEGPPKDEWRLLPLSHLEHHEVGRDEVVFDIHGDIHGGTHRIANGVITQLQAHGRRL
jgi:hypothetical protein